MRVRFKWLGRIELAIFGLCWAGFGIAAFVQITIWGHEYERKMSLIAEGKVPAENLYIASVVENHDPEGYRRWDVGLSRDKPDRAKIVETRVAHSADEATIGESVKAFRFNDEYLIPRFDRGGHNWGRWVFLAFGLVPPLAVAAFVAWFHKRATDLERKTVPGADQ